jgi:SAM-dependent methyltransferase
MAERAHPDDPGFRARLGLVRKFRILPWPAVVKSPYRRALDWRYRWVSQYGRGRDVLDVPCGVGWGTSMLRGCRSIVGVDIERAAIEEARRRYGRTAEFAVGGMDRLDFPDGRFDVVSCLEGIEHVPVETGRAFLAEAHRVLRPGGRLLVSSPYCRTAMHSGNPYHVHEYRPDEIRAEIGRHFHIEDITERDVDVVRVMYISALKLELR